MSYRYERYFDTDAANVDIDAILGLTTLGLMDNNFNAHQVSFLYKKSF
ncbi:MAG: MtrB/PioB family outer membrane beta-barrel protein [Shewanella sp.]